MLRGIKQLICSQEVVVLEFKPYVTPNPFAFCYNTVPSLTCHSYIENSSSYKDERDHKSGVLREKKNHWNFIIFRKPEEDNPMMEDIRDR